MVVLWSWGWAGLMRVCSKRFAIERFDMARRLA